MKNRIIALMSNNNLIEDNGKKIMYLKSKQYLTAYFFSVSFNSNSYNF